MVCAEDLDPTVHVDRDFERRAGRTRWRKRDFGPSISHHKSRDETPKASLRSPPTRTRTASTGSPPRAPLGPRLRARALRPAVGQQVPRVERIVQLPRISKSPSTRTACRRASGVDRQLVDEVRHHLSVRLPHQPCGQLIPFTAGRCSRPRCLRRQRSRSTTSCTAARLPDSSRARTRGGHMALPFKTDAAMGAKRRGENMNVGRPSSSLRRILVPLALA